MPGKILQVAAFLSGRIGDSQECFLEQCFLKVSPDVHQHPPVGVLILGGYNAVRTKFQQALQENEDIIGIDFYGHGQDGCLKGNDGNALLDNQNIALVQGKGLDVLACGYENNPDLFGQLALQAGARFVLFYTSLVHTLTDADFVTAMTTAKSALYQGKNFQVAYLAQQQAMRNLDARIGMLRPDISVALQFSLRNYTLNYPQ